MTIDEAIKHAEEVADNHDRIKQIKAVTLEECRCANEHRQLAEWLKELKQLREQTRWIPCSERLPEEKGGYLVTVKRGYITTALWVGYPVYWKEVTAWMPLPEPYKAEMEVENE